jgi:hypothetical protein
VTDDGIGATEATVEVAHKGDSEVRGRLAVRHWNKSFRGGGYSALLIVGILSAITMWVFKLQLFEHWSFPWDFLGTYSTTPAFVADTIGRGHPLFWSPFVASGFPVDVDPQAGVYFPVWWILGVLRIAPTLHVLTIVQVIHVFFAGAGVFVLARARRLELPWATVAAIAYIFFGGFYGQSEHADIVRGFAYLPWFLWALTPPQGTSGSWTRLVALPPIAWLIASGAYPGQIVSFGIVGFVYMSVSLWFLDRSVWRRYRGALLMAGIACVAICATVLLPYIRAEQAGELYRTIEPTAVVRAGFSLSPLDLFGLYLNNFAWVHEGTITSWAVGVPILLGIASAGALTFRRHSPLIACGIVALILAMAPKVGPIGRAMASLRVFFPSRFPASDYKSAVALVLILLSADSWSRIAARTRARPRIAATLAACVLIAGALLVPSTYAKPTYALWLVLLVVGATTILAITRPPKGVLVIGLIALMVIDGTREIGDYRLAGTNSPWKEPPSALAFFEARNQYVQHLPERLREPVKTRPARVPATSTAEPDASGWVADAYHETDYDPTVERSLWLAEHNPEWSTKLLEPWHAYTFPCSQVGCYSGQVHLHAATTWQVSKQVTTLSYGDARISYMVDATKPLLMVENELAVRGWQTNTPKVKTINAGVPLRAWRLAPGRYRFVANFQEPGRWLQWVALVFALLSFAGSTLLLVCRPVRGLMMSRS